MNRCGKAEELKDDQNDETEKPTLLFNGEVSHLLLENNDKGGGSSHLGTQFQTFLKKTHICKRYSVEQQMKLQRGVGMVTHTVIPTRGRGSRRIRSICG